MMQISDLTIRLIILIIPGIVVTLIVDTLTTHREWSPFRFSIYSIVLGVASYLFDQLFLYLWRLLTLLFISFPITPSLTFWSSLFDNKIPISINEVILTCLFSSLFLGFLITFIINHQFLYKIAVKLKVSDVYGEEELFTHFIRADDVKWVWVRCKTASLTYAGYIKHFAENEKLQEIELGDVTVYNSEDSCELYKLSKIYLASPPGDFTIEISE
jgi:hypothetical protein